MSPPQDIGDQALIGAAQPSGATYSTASSDCILAGGTNPAWTAHDYAMKFVSGTWSNITALPADRQLLMGGGNYDDGIMMGGDSSGTSNVEDDVYGWSGSAWSSLALMSTGNMMFAGGGNTTDAIWYGGTYSYVDTCQTFNGTSWTTENTMTHGTRGCVGSGKSDGAWCMGGYTTGASNQTYNQQFNGTSWSDSTTCPTTTFYSYNGGAGQPSTAIVSQNAGSTGGCYMFDGSAFSLTGNTNYNRNYRMMGGDSSDAMKAGGSDNGNTDTTELYNGSTWSTSGDMTVSTFGTGMGGNS